MTVPNPQPGLPRTNNLGPEIAVVEMGGVEDTRVRPLREVLRELHEQAETDPGRKASPPQENGATGLDEEPTVLRPDKVGEDTAIVWMGGEEDTRVRPLSEYLREVRERVEKRKKENGEAGTP